jgi:3',5'-cyclic AMP phosphodiesterase CpdA
MNQCKIFSLICAFFILSNPVYVANASTVKENSPEECHLPRFAVISDTHFENNRGESAEVKVPRALKNLLSKTPQIDAVFVVGDLTDHGRLEEYDRLTSVFGDKANVPEGIDVYFCMGYNHDRFGEAVVENYLNKVKQPLHQYVEIKAYPFITISEGGTRQSAHNDEALKFLTEKLADASVKYPGKPIFVFMHIPPLNTCYGSMQNEGWGTDIFLPVLERYPQAVVFSGHSHFPLGDPRSIHQDKFTAVNDGSTTYSEIEPNVVNKGIHPENYEYVTEGILVNVQSNGDVEMERWDTYRNEEILPRWTVEAPHNGSRFSYKNRNGLPAPVFPKQAKPDVKHATNDSITVTFPQASDNDVVHHYIVEIVDDDGKVIASFGKFSQFYLNSMAPKELSVGFSALPSGRKLTPRVIAIDSYNNRSVPVYGKSFTVKP